jgi:hypothetical protein
MKVTAVSCDAAFLFKARKVRTLGEEIGVGKLQVSYNKRGCLIARIFDGFDGTFEHFLRRC